MTDIGDIVPDAIMLVRALYDYEADDQTSLSFHEGDIIQVITQLESGWWDGVINGIRGWFPSNYCEVIGSPEDILDEKHLGGIGEDDLDDEDYDDQFGDDDSQESENEREFAQLSAASAGIIEEGRADYWIPQATPDGRLFYYNTMTGESSMELPLESPSSPNETGPRDHIHINIPDKTRAPPELLAQGYIPEEDYDSEGNSASELDGESIINSMVGSLDISVHIY